MTTPEPSVAPRNRSDRLFLGSLAVVAVVIGLLAGAGVQRAFIDAQTPWNPLGPFPVQHVTNPRKVPLDALVYVEAKKCARETVNVTSVIRWVYSSGAITTGTGAGEIKKGCMVFSDNPKLKPDQPAFHNSIPASVQAQQRQLCAAGLTNEPWRVTAELTPHKDGRSGGVAVWSTEVFTLACS